jgi:hypothetical protein
MALGKKDKNSDQLYMLTEDFKLKEITREEQIASIQKGKKQILKKLENCIDEGKPFLLITSEDDNMDSQNLRLSTSVIIKDMPKMLGPFLLSIPHGAARYITDTLSDMVFLKWIEDFVIERTESKIAQFALQTSTQNLNKASIKIPLTLSDFNG